MRHAKPSPRYARRRLWAPLLAGLLALGLALGAAWLILLWKPDPGAATAGLQAARPWLLITQITVLALAWHFWPECVGWLGQRRGWPEEAQLAMLRGRGRIFALLGAMELVILLRALA